jgi:acylpyruvate hydrolase
VEGDEVEPLGQPDIGALLAAGSLEGAAAAMAGPRRALAEQPLAPVVVWPEKVLCVGLNYVSHIDELGRPRPTHPTLFAKLARSLLGPHDVIALPGVTQADWEAELAVVVGRPLRRGSTAEAAAAIAGYTVCNDITARDWQDRTPQWFQGKAFERSTPLGPCLVTPDEVDDAADLRITCSVDGEVVQDARTSDLLFRPAEVLAYISQIVTLVPGDVVSLGTPGGIGHTSDPPRHLQPGQVVRTEIEGIGVLENVFAGDAG